MIKTKTTFYSTCILRCIKWTWPTKQTNTHTHTYKWIWKCEWKWKFKWNCRIKWCSFGSFVRCTAYTIVLCASLAWWQTIHPIECLWKSLEVEYIAHLHHSSLCSMLNYVVRILTFFNLPICSGQSSKWKRENPNEKKNNFLLIKKFTEI